MPKHRKQCVFIGMFGIKNSRGGKRRGMGTVLTLENIFSYVAGESKQSIFEFTILCDKQRLYYKIFTSTVLSGCFILSRECYRRFRR